MHRFILWKAKAKYNKSKSQTKKNSSSSSTTLFLFFFFFFFWFSTLLPVIPRCRIWNSYTNTRTKKKKKHRLCMHSLVPPCVYLNLRRYHRWNKAIIASWETYSRAWWTKRRRRCDIYPSSVSIYPLHMFRVLLLKPPSTLTYCRIRLHPNIHNAKQARKEKKNCLLSIYTLSPLPALLLPFLFHFIFVFFSPLWWILYLAVAYLFLDFNPFCFILEN